MTAFSRSFYFEYCLAVFFSCLLFLVCGGVREPDGRKRAFAILSVLAR